MEEENGGGVIKGIKTEINTTWWLKDIGNFTHIYKTKKKASEAGRILR